MAVSASKSAKYQEVGIVQVRKTRYLCTVKQIINQ